MHEHQYTEIHILTPWHAVCLAACDFGCGVDFCKVLSSVKRLFPEAMSVTHLAPWCRQDTLQPSSAPARLHLS